MSESRYPPAVIESVAADTPLNCGTVKECRDKAISDAFAGWYKDQFGINAARSFWKSTLYLAFKAGVAFAEGKR
jgi:hypothetical protein